jgi:ketosteroid isomerase-like protein
LGGPTQFGNFGKAKSRKQKSVDDLSLIFETYKNAVFQKDIEAFASVFDEKVQVFDMWERWAYDGLPAWKKMAEGWFESLGTDKDVVTFDDIRIQASGEMAVVTSFVRFTAISEKGEELRYLENRLTWVAFRKGEVWKISHQHTSGPIDSATMKVILTK